MSKVFVRLGTYVGEDGYVSGTHVMNEARWEKWRKIYSKMDIIKIYYGNTKMDITPDEFFEDAIEVTKITDEEYAVLKRLNLVGRGQDLPEARYDEDLGENISGFWLNPEPPYYKIMGLDTKTYKKVDIEDKII